MIVTFGNQWNSGAKSKSYTTYYFTQCSATALIFGIGGLGKAAFIVRSMIFLFKWNVSRRGALSVAQLTRSSTAKPAETVRSKINIGIIQKQVT